MDNFDKLHQTEHMLKWLDDEPYESIRSEVEDMLQQQVAGSALNSFRVVSDPQWLTGARKPEDGGSKVILVRVGVAFEFELSVDGNGRTHELNGVFTWAGFSLDDPANRRRQVWLDIDGDLETFGSEGELVTRIYSA
ncbi:hypothetical protein [Pseudoduganella sp. HUAS MS19]